MPDARPFRLEERLALTIAEAAQAIGVSERLLRDFLPEIPHVHIGKRVVIPVRELRDWLGDRAREEGSRADRIADEIIAKLQSS